jgi:outer membrane protein assembly factor BamB
MKRTIVIILSFIFLFCPTFSTSLYSRILNLSSDNKGNDPWTSFLHDDSNSGFSSTKIGSNQKFIKKISYLGDKDIAGAVVYNDTIIISCTSVSEEYSEVIAFDAENLEKKWNTVFEERICATPPVINTDKKTFFVAANNGYGTRNNSDSTIYCLNLENGDFEWMAQVEGAIFGPLIYYNDLLFYLNFFTEGTNSGTISDPGDFGCLNALNGSKKWINPLQYSFMQGWTNNLHPAVFNNNIIVPNTFLVFENEELQIPGDALVFYSFNSSNGNKNWVIEKENCLLPSVSADRDVFYLTYTENFRNDFTQKLEAYTSNENLKWSYSIPNNVGFSSTPIFNDSYVFIRNRSGNIYCIDKETGKKIWSFSSAISNPTGDGSAYAVNNNYLVSSIFSENANKSYINMMDLSSKSSVPIWKETINDLVFQIILYDSKVYFIGVDNIYLYQSEMPELNVKPESIIKTVDEKTKTIVKLEITNIGKGILSGSLSTTENWIKINPNRFSNDAIIEVTIDSMKLTKGSYSDNIVILSNGGNKTIPVKIDVLEKDITPPVIEIYSPENEEKTKENSVTVTGKVYDEESQIEILKINNKNISYDSEGIFKHSIDLSLGENNIEIQAWNSENLSTLRSLTLYRINPDSTGPEIKILSPKDGFITNLLNVDIIGTVEDHESTVESLTINSQPVLISDNGSFESKNNSLHEGVNEFVITATNSESISTTEVLKVTLDTTPPFITLINPKKDLIVKHTKFFISFSVEDIGSGIEEVFIGEKKVTVSSDGIVESNLDLNEGANTFQIRATDFADNTSMKEVSIICDTNPPVLNLTTPFSQNSLQYQDEFPVQFYASDEGSGLLAVSIADQQGNTLQIEENGSRYQATLPLQKGVNLFTITAIDNAGNETKQSIQLRYQPAVVITLTIGNSVATVQKNKDIRDIVMKVPPMIVKGTTFVPIRFIAETFGARVEWIPHPTNEIQIYFKDILIHLWINKTIGVVERGTETKKVTLLAAPFITNSTTMVPLRFISENLDAQVVWDAPTSTITIIQAVE